MTRATEIAHYPSLDPKEQPAVRFEGVVTFVDPTGTVFLQDDSGATFIKGAERWKTMQPGQRLAVRGQRYPGLFIGGIVPETVTDEGTAPLPEPRLVTPEDLASARFHYQLVEIEGVGRAYEVTGENTATLELNAQGQIVEVRFDQAPDDPTALIDAEVRVRGLAAGAINDRRQLVAPYIRLADGRALSILKPAPADPFAAAALPLSALLDAAATRPPPHRVKVRGTAISSVIGGGVFLREDGRSTFVQTDTAVPITPGDEVEALGFANMGVFSAMLAHGELHVLDHGEAPAPLLADARMLKSGTCDAELVELDARLVQSLPSEGALLVQSGGQNIRVFAPRDAPRDIEPGSALRLTGLCRVTAIRRDGYRAAPTSYDLWLRSPQDISILSAPPWWTARRLSLGLASAAAVAVLALGWIALLRRQVAKQLALLQTKAQVEAVQEERQRIAREFHDTLEQELAGLSLRLDAAATRVSDGKARGLLEQQRKLLSRLQTETRDFVWDLRDPSRVDSPLPEALRSLLHHLQASTATPLRLTCTGSAEPLPPLVQHHLLRITREAVHNAIKYARASMIQVALDHDANHLRLTVTDDGNGFDVDAANALDGHFGIRGIKERVRKIGAELQIKSAPGSGTSVGLTLPAPAMRA